jgi:galactokinase
MTLEQRADELAREFTRHVGGEPDGVWTAPGRVNLIGEHTDYNAGFVLPVAIGLSCLVAARRRDDGVLRLRSVQAGAAESVGLDGLAPKQQHGWAAYAAGTAWALQQEGVDVPGADVVLSSDVPSGAGLASSAALECAVGLALVDLAGTPLDRTALALAGQRAEVEVVGAPVGVMDQLVSVHGHAGSAVLIDCRSLDVRAVPLALHRHGLQLVVVDTGVTHAHATGGYGDRRRACEQAAALLGVPALRDATLEQVEAAAQALGEQRRRRARHVVTENQRVVQTVAALERDDVAALGPLLAASHASLRDDFEVSSAELDTAVDAALQGGAVAARMTGGGFGGSVVAVVPSHRVADVETRCVQAAAAAGHPVPVVRRVEPSAGAARLR